MHQLAQVSLPQKWRFSIILKTSSPSNIHPLILIKVTSRVPILIGFLLALLWNTYEKEHVACCPGQGGALLNFSSRAMSLCLKAIKSCRLLLCSNEPQPNAQLKNLHPSHSNFTTLQLPSSSKFDHCNTNTNSCNAVASRNSIRMSLYFQIWVIVVPLWTYPCLRIPKNSKICNNHDPRQTHHIPSHFLFPRANMTKLSHRFLLLTKECNIALWIPL